LTFRKKVGPKLRLHSRMEAVLYAVREKLVEL